MKDEQEDRERTADSISLELKAKAAQAVDSITQEIVKLLDQRKSPLLVAIDGGTGAGKSTLALLVAARVGAVVVQGDDFCQTEIDWSRLSAQQKAELCIDWTRARREALEPLLAGKIAKWHPFNFVTGKGFADYLVVRKPAPVIILDGIYSATPQLADIVGLTVLVDTPTTIRYARHNDREGHDDHAWHKVWNEAEEYYFTQFRAPSSFDLVVSF